MSKHAHRILAIDPGTREMGVAFLDGDKLVYHGVEAISRNKTPHEKLREGRKAVLRLIRDLRPQILAVEKTFFGSNRNSALLNVFADEIQAIGRRKGLKVLSFAPSAVKKFVTGNGWASKAEVARFVISEHPELKIYLTQDRAWKERYHQNMFHAVAVGMTAMGNRA